MLNSRPCRIHPSAASDHDGARGDGRRVGVRGDSDAFIRIGTACIKQARYAIGFCCNSGAGVSEALRFQRSQNASE